MGVYVLLKKNSFLFLKCRTPPTTLQYPNKDGRLLEQVTVAFTIACEYLCKFLTLTSRYYVNTL